VEFTIKNVETTIKTQGFRNFANTCLVLAIKNGILIPSTYGVTWGVQKHSPRKMGNSSEFGVQPSTMMFLELALWGNFPGSQIPCHREIVPLTSGNDGRMHQYNMDDPYEYHGSIGLNLNTQKHGEKWMINGRNWQTIVNIS
jgi:hypothetical protein